MDPQIALILGIAAPVLSALVMIREFMLGLRRRRIQNEGLNVAPSINAAQEFETTRRVPKDAVSGDSTLWLRTQVANLLETLDLHPGAEGSLINLRTVWAIWCETVTREALSPPNRQLVGMLNLMQAGLLGEVSRAQIVGFHPLRNKVVHETKNLIAALRIQNEDCWEAILHPSAKLMSFALPLKTSSSRGRPSHDAATVLITCSALMRGREVQLYEATENLASSLQRFQGLPQSDVRPLDLFTLQWAYSLILSLSSLSYSQNRPLLDVSNDLSESFIRAGVAIRSDDFRQLAAEIYQLPQPHYVR